MALVPPNLLNMRLVQRVAVFLLVATPNNTVWAELTSPKHSLDAFARNVFETFKGNDFGTFHQHTIFALSEEQFKRFLFEVKNDEIRDTLSKGQWSQWKENTRIQRKMIEEEIKKKEEEGGEINSLTAQTEIKELKVKIVTLERELLRKWAVVCAQKWRNNYSRLKSIVSSARREAFDPILTGAEKEGIQWQTARLTAVEILHEISFANNHFKIDGVEAPILQWYSGLTYRLHFDKTMHGKPFRLATLPEGPTPYEHGIAREKTGDKDLLARFRAPPEALYYYCPAKEKMGNRIHFSNPEKHLRHNVLLTFSYGSPQHGYRILLRDCLPIPARSAPRAGATWNQWLLFERPVWLGPIRKDPSID